MAAILDCIELGYASMLMAMIQEREREKLRERETKGFMITKKWREKGIKRMNEGNLYLIMGEMLYSCNWNNKKEDWCKSVCRYCSRMMRVLF